jgi:hypothetical protein
LHVAVAALMLIGARAIRYFQLGSIWGIPNGSQWCFLIGSDWPAMGLVVLQFPLFAGAVLHYPDA